MNAQHSKVYYGCSIVIPTYNRPDYLRRILSYYNKYGGDYNIIVADSSSDENKKLNNKLILSFSNLNILHLFNYHSDILATHKIADAINYVEDKYCVLCADDDFITPNGINKSVDFLEKNPDFTVAHGHYISFFLKNEKEEKPTFCWQPIYPYQSITFSDAESRLIFYFSNFTITNFYGVHRTDFLKMLFEEALKFTDDYQFSDLLLSMLALIYGKMKRLDVLYAARESIPTSAGKRSETLRNFVKNGTYDIKYGIFRERSATHLCKMSQLDLEESKKVVDKAILTYRAKYSESYKYRSRHKMKEILDLLKLPDWLDGWIRATYKKLFLSKQIRMEEFWSSMDIVSSKYYEDFNSIRIHVLSNFIQRSKS